MGFHKKFGLSLSMDNEFHSPPAPLPRTVHCSARNIAGRTGAAATLLDNDTGNGESQTKCYTWSSKLSSEDNRVSTIPKTARKF